MKKNNENNYSSKVVLVNNVLHINQRAISSFKDFTKLVNMPIDISIPLGIGYS